MRIALVKFLDLNWHLNMYNNNSLNALKFALHTLIFSFSFSDLFVATLEPMFATAGSVFKRGGEV